MPRSKSGDRWRALRRRTKINRTLNRFDSKPEDVECECGQDGCRCELTRRSLIVKYELYGHLSTESRDDDRSRFGVVGGVGFYHAAPIGVNGRAHYCRRLVREWKHRMRVAMASG